VIPSHAISLDDCSLYHTIRVLGFHVVSVRYPFKAHDLSYQWAKPQGEVLRPSYHPCFTIVGERTRQERSNRT